MEPIFVKYLFCKESKVERFYEEQKFQYLRLYGSE